MVLSSVVLISEVSGGVTEAALALDVSTLTDIVCVSSDSEIVLAENSDFSRLALVFLMENCLNLFASVTDDASGDCAVAPSNSV